MTWAQPIEKAPTRELEVWDTNERVYAEWVKRVGKRGAKNSQRNNLVYVKVFVRMFSALVTTLGKQDVESFVDRISAKCSRLILSEVPECRGNEHDVTQCPLLRSASNYTECGGYQPLDPAGVWAYICAINRFYEWLLEEGRIARNPALGVMRDFASRYSAFFDERRRKPRRRDPTLEEVRLLVQQSPIQHGIGYLLMAKCLIRIHEVLKLSWAPGFYNLEEGWMDIPMDWDLGNKRKGNMRIILDSEAKRWIRVYRAWWDDHVERDEHGQPTHQRFLITIFGRPWATNSAIHNYNTTLHTNAERLKLMTGEESRREQRLNSHGFRAFGTTAARERGAQDADIQVMRGDKAPGSIDRYDAYLRRLPELYRKFGPVLEV
ncbi:MAG TPA: site-specific integrase [Candidatus Thermoplasmatota archaeon]|nr:site-specific integrase [Candidatus Thermoplasmatota archaeon]